MSTSTPTLSFLTVPGPKLRRAVPLHPQPVAEQEEPRHSFSTIGSTETRPRSVISGAVSAISATSGNEIVFGLGNVVDGAEGVSDSSSVAQHVQTAHDHEPIPIPLPELDEGERLFLPLPTRYVFIFVNPRSGPQQGRILLENVEVQHYRMKSFPMVQVQLYDITNDSDRKLGMDYLKWIWYHSPVFREHHQELHIWSAGGDGTFKSVLDICLGLGIDLTSPVLFFSVIPFGTGNDLSQVMGWGRTVPERDVAGHRLERLNHLVVERLNGVAARLDIWEIDIEVGDNGFVKKAKKKRHGREDPEGPPITHLTTKMSNYFSLGIQGIIGSYFEAHRTSSRIGNILMYARASAHFLFRGFPRVMDSLKEILVGGAQAIAIGRAEREQARRQSLVVPVGGTNAVPSAPAPFLRHNAVELIIANIPGLWGRQVDLWSQAKVAPSVVDNGWGPTDYRTWTPNAANDGKCEVFMIRNVGEYFLKQLPWHRGKLSRIGQFPTHTKIEFRENVHTYCNIDGEFFELSNPKSISFRLVTTVKVVCPADPKRSRLARDENLVPGGVNSDVLPLDAMV